MTQPAGIAVLVHLPYPNQWMHSRLHWWDLCHSAALDSNTSSCWWIYQCCLCWQWKRQVHPNLPSVTCCSTRQEKKGRQKAGMIYCIQAVKILYPRKQNCKEQNNRIESNPSFVLTCLDSTSACNNYCEANARSKHNARNVQCSASSDPGM